MKIGILVSYIGNFGAKGLYNSQEVGMAKELNRNGNEVIIYKLISNKSGKNIQVDEIKKGLIVKYIPVNSLGTHGLINLNELDRNLEVLIHFSDIQLIFKRVYRWCKVNNVKIIPYVGVIKSNSDNKIKRIITNILGRRNIILYKKCYVLAKTPHVKEQLQEYKIKQVDVLPVGLDVSILHKDYEKAVVSDLKSKWGFAPTDKVMLFIGRLVYEKQPIKLIDIFERVHKQDSSFKLLIIGTGTLHDDVQKIIDEKHLNNFVKMIDKVLNVDIWELYRISEVFINLNQQEIFGMAILEAMYYGCKVIAWEAPGPNFIIENGVSGILCKSDDEIINGLLKQSNDMKAEAHRRIINKFTWSSTAAMIEEIVKENYDG